MTTAPAFQTAKHLTQQWVGFAHFPTFQRLDKQLARMG
jgi:hypothetical protein